MTAFLNSDVFAGMNRKAVEDMGVRVLSAAVDQPRILYTREPVSSVDDVQGIKMRVPGIKAYLRLWETVGTVPTQVAWAEAFLALRTGAVDGAEADASGAYSQKFHVAAPNITLTNHLMSALHISVNEARWQGLGADEQAALEAAAEAAVSWASETAKTESQAVLDKMVSEGATVFEIDNGPFAEKAGKAAPDILDRQPGKDGDSVETLLSMRFNIIAALLKRLPRKVLVRGLDFLQQGNIRPRLVQPVAERTGARLDPVDVECCNLHGCTPPVTQETSLTSGSFP